MSTIKNGHISLYCHSNKIIKGPGTSFQSPALSQKHVRNVCRTADWHLNNLRNNYKCNLHYATMPAMTSQILKSVNFTKIQKSRYLENKTLFFLQIKKIINYSTRATLWQKVVLERR